MKEGNEGKEGGKERGKEGGKEGVRERGKEKRKVRGKEGGWEGRWRKETPPGQTMLSSVCTTDCFAPFATCIKQVN